MEFLAALLSWLANSILPAFAALVGIAALVTVVVGALKKYGVIPDGEAGNYANGINLVLFVGFVVLNVVGIPLPPAVDQIAGIVAQLLAALLGIALQLKVSPAAYKIAKAYGIPLAGFSHSK